MTSKFKVDLNSGDRPERFSSEGEYIVTIAGVERNLTSQGFEKAVITFTDEKSRTIKDDILNKDTVWWRINQLIVASGMKVPHGTEYDFAKTGEFFNLIKSSVGLKVKLVLRNDTYEKNGETKTILKVSKYTKADADAPF